MALKPKGKPKTELVASAPAPAAPVPSAAEVTAALRGAPVSITEDGGRIAIALRADRQFAPGSTQPAPQLRALFQKIAASLDKAPGAIAVVGYADSSPTQHYASNLELSAERAKTVAQIMAAKLADPRRLSAEGTGEADPLAPDDTDANRAKNRRVVIVLKPNP